MKLVTLDQKYSESLRKLGSRNLSFWFFIATWVVYAFGIFGGVMALAGRFNFLALVVVGVITHAITLAFQKFIRRDRPNFKSTTGYKMWFETYSCPSGHSSLSAAFAITLILVPHYDSPLAFLAATIALIFAALLVGLSRIMVGVHYLGDVILGLSLGTLIALLFVFSPLG